MSKYNWPEIFKTFEESGLSQTQFCKEQNINVKYFNLRYSKHRSDEACDQGFTKIDVQPSESAALTLQIGQCTIHCSNTMPIDSFVSLVRKLA